MGTFFILNQCVEETLNTSTAGAQSNAAKK